MSENVYNLIFILNTEKQYKLDAKVVYNTRQSSLSDFFKYYIITYIGAKINDNDISVTIINGTTYVKVIIKNQTITPSKSASSSTTKSASSTKAPSSTTKSAPSTLTYTQISKIEEKVKSDNEKKITIKINGEETYIKLKNFFKSLKLLDETKETKKRVAAWDEQLRQKICSTESKLTEQEALKFKPYGIFLTYDNDEFDITLFDRKLLEESIVQVVSNYGPLTKELLALNVYCGSVKVAFNIYENDLRNKIETNLVQIHQEILELYSSKIKEKEDKKYLKTLLINTLYDYKKNPYNICDTNSMDCIKNKNVPLPYNDRYEKYSLKNIYDTPMETVEIVTDTPTTPTTTILPRTKTTTTTTTTTQKPTTTTKREPYTCRTYITNKDDERVEPLNIDIDNDNINKIYNPFIFTSNENNICKKLYKYKYNNGVSFLENNSDNKIDKKTDCKFYKFVVNKNNNFDQNYTVLDNLVKNYCKRIM